MRQTLSKRKRHNCYQDTEFKKKVLSGEEWILSVARNIQSITEEVE